MATHEVEVKPYGTKNEIETRVNTNVGSSRTDDELKPPYGQRNTAGISTSVPQVTTSTTPSFIGSRSDVEVKPFGTQDMADKPQRVATTTVRRTNNIDWKNPLLATLLGITLALTLLSLSYLPRAISGLWHWGTDWTHREKSYDRYPQPREDIYRERETYRDRRDQSSGIYETAKDTVNSVKDRVEQTGEYVYDRARQTGENVYNTAKDAVYRSSSGSLTEDAKQAACNAAEKARDTACNGVNMRGWRDMKDSAYDRATGMYRDAMHKGDEVRDTAYEASDRASGLFDKAKQKAEEVLEAAKNTVTYPINAAGERIEAARERVMHRGSDLAHDTVSGAENLANSAKDTAYNAGQAAKDTALNAGQAAKDTVLNAGQAAKDTVLNAGQAAKDTVLNVGQAAKEKVFGAGEAARDMAENAKDRVRDTTHSHTHTHETNQRGPTRVKVEVQEM
jgi:gas vesicle protein